MASVQVATRAEISSGSMKAFQIGDERLLVAHCEDGFYAISGVCSHLGGDLSKGRLEGFVVTCPRHGSRFDVRTGENVGPPKIGFIKLKAPDVKSYAVTVEGESVSVELD